MKDMSLIYQMKQNRNYSAIYLDELQFSFKRGDRGCVMRYLCFGICIYIVSVVTAVRHMVIARDCKR